MKRWMFTKLFLLVSPMYVCAMTLNEVAQQTVNTHPSVLRALKECMAAKAEWKGSYGGYFPTVDLNAGWGVEYSRNQSTRPRPGGTDTLTRRELGVEARQMLFDGFATKNNVQRTRAKADAFAWAVVGEANDAALRATEAYLSVLKQRELVKSAEDNLGVHQRTADMITRRSSSGVSKQADVMQSQGRLAQARSNLRTEEGHLRDAEIAYFRETGTEPPVLKNVDLDNRVLPKSLQEAVDISIKNHPRLKSANADIEERMGQYRFSQSNYFPFVEAVLSATRNNNIDGIRGINDDAAAMLRARWNVFRGGRDRAKQQETAYMAQEAAEIRNRTYRQIVENTSLTWVAYKYNEKLLVDFKKHADAARETIDAYSKQFQLGQRTLLDLLNSENEYFHSKRVYITNKYDLLLSKFRLLNSMGTLLTYLGVDMDQIGGYKDLKGILNLPTQRPKELKLAAAKTVTAQTQLAKAKEEAQPQAPQAEADLKDDSASGQSYTIQLLASGNEEALHSFVDAYQLADEAAYYRTKRKDGSDWYILVYGNYPSLKTANAAIANLPEECKSFLPWVRTLPSKKKLALIRFEHRKTT